MVSSARVAMVTALLSFAASGCFADDLKRMAIHSSFALTSTYAFTQTVTIDAPVATTEDLTDFSQFTVDFEPTSSAVEFLEAWVDLPDSARRTADDRSVFTRPTAAAQTSPGFVSKQTKTLILPPLKVGSRVHVKYRLTVERADAFGFNEINVFPLNRAMDLGVSVTLPANLRLNIAHRGPFQVSDSTSGAVRTIEATISRDRPILKASEPYAPAPLEVAPLFQMSSLDGFQELGAIYYRNSVDKQTVTPEIAQLASQIVGSKTGVEAARAIHDWVARNIRYLAVWLGDTAAMVPHDAATVLKNGYGDCKDHVALMQALLAAVNIRSAPALVQWGTLFQPLPLWSTQGINHVMVYLPDHDLYANPTSPFTPFGVLDHTLSGKPVVIASEQPELRRTPDLAPADARFHTSARITLGTEGTIAGTATITMSPVFAIAMRARLANPGADATQLKTALEATPEGGFGQLRSTAPLDLERDFKAEAAWVSPHGFPASAPYLALPSGPNLAPISPLRSFLNASGTRVLPLVLGAADVSWSLVIKLPNGRAAGQAPPAVNLENAVAAYSAGYEVVDDEVRVTRRLVFKQNEVAPESYGDLQTILYGALDDQRAIVSLIARP